MACHLSPSHYLNRCWCIINWTLKNIIQWNFNKNTMIFVQENEMENILCKILAILSWPQCVDGIALHYYLNHVGLLSIKQGTNYNKILIKMPIFWFRKMCLKMSVEWRPFCHSCNVLDLNYSFTYSSSFFRTTLMHGPSLVISIWPNRSGDLARRNLSVSCSGQPLRMIPTPWSPSATYGYRLYISLWGIKKR